MAGEWTGELVGRLAGPADARVIAEITAEGFRGYRDWAPPGWAPPRRSEGEQAELELGEALARSDVWCLLALVEERPAGHVALSPVTFVEPEASPQGTVNLWQLFVRPPWRGSGLAARLLDAAVVEGAPARLRADAALDAARRAPGAPLLRTRGLEYDGRRPCRLAARASDRRVRTPVARERPGAAARRHENCDRTRRLSAATAAR